MLNLHLVALDSDLPSLEAYIGVLTTCLPVDHVVTDGSVLTGLTGTLIDVHLTVDAVEPGGALAQVHGDQVLAGGSVKTRVGLTLVYFDLTVASCRRGGVSSRDCTGKCDIFVNPL